VVFGIGKVYKSRSRRRCDRLEECAALRDSVGVVDDHDLVRVADRGDAEVAAPGQIEDVVVRIDGVDVDPVQILLVPIGDGVERR